MQWTVWLFDPIVIVFCYLRLYDIQNHIQIGKMTFDKIRQEALTNTTPLLAAARTTQITGKAQAALEQYVSLVSDSLADFGQLSLLVEHIVTSTKMIAYLSTQRSPQTESKIENIKELINAAKYYDKYDSIQDALNEFLSHAVLDQTHESEHAAQQVQLMTLHAAKGLEFPVVFLVGLEDDLFPHKMTHADDMQIEEERRLCYVGMTRAEKTLFLSYAETRRLYGQEMYQRPSRFIRELPSDLIDNLRVTKTTRITQQKTTFEFKLGQNVKHEKFGEGVVLNYEEGGDNSRIQVRFISEGTKWLLCAYANLSIA